jgi:predicted esterase
MKAKCFNIRASLPLAGLFVMGLLVSACGVAAARPVPILPLEETSATEFVIDDFDAVHAQVNGDVNEYLIFGNLPVLEPAADIPPELAVFLGRWEGYSFSPPIKKDRKVVLVIQEITPQGGKGFVWSGTNLQYPDIVGEIRFRVVPGEIPSVEWQFVWPDGRREIASFTYHQDKALLIGWTGAEGSSDTSGPYELSRDRSFNVYKDYAGYLETRFIYPREYQSEDLQQYGKGYLLYLPEGYESNSEKTWPLLFFLHGSGDRGDNLLLLPKASPFMMIREKGPLPFIIVAPLLSDSYLTFTNDYMDAALKEIMTNYRVDPKRIYLTGMSMGGEAAYRFALHQPDTFAAVASLCAFLDTSQNTSNQGIEGMPVWAIHGSDDQIIPLVWGQQAAQALETAGADVRFSVLQGYDHDVWTDTYSDPQFYKWFMQYRTP